MTISTGEMEYICPKFCTEWYESCKDEHYTAASDGGRLIPCYGNALICSPLNQIVSDGNAFCQRLSFEPLTRDDNDDRPAAKRDDAKCFDGRNVPQSTGITEPTESLYEQFERFMKDQQENPSEWGIVAMALSFLMMILAKKIVSRGRTCISGGTSNEHGKPLSLEEIRQRQQDQYAALAQVAGMDSSSSDEEES